MVTNSESLAKAIGRANCNAYKEVEDAVNEEVKKQHWESAHVQLEQHMKVEDEVRANWLCGKFEEGK